MQIDFRPMLFSFLDFFLSILFRSPLTLVYCMELVRAHFLFFVVFLVFMMFMDFL